MNNSDIWLTVKKRRCVVCNKMTAKWQKIDRGPIHCFDGCHSTTGYDRRTCDGKPLWEKKYA